MVYVGPWFVPSCQCCLNIHFQQTFVEAVQAVRTLLCLSQVSPLSAIFHTWLIHALQPFTVVKVFKAKN